MSLEGSSNGFGLTAQPTKGGGTLMSVLMRRAWIIVVTAVLVAVAAGAFAYFVRNTYDSSAQLLFDQTVGNQLNALGLNPPFNNADRLAGDDVATVSSRAVASLTAQRLGPRFTVASVQKDVAVAGTKTDDVVTVTATASSAREAYRVARTYSVTAIDLVQQAEVARARAVMVDLQGQLATLPPKLRNGFGGQQILLKIAQLHALTSAGSGNPRLIQPAYVPTAKSGKLAQTIGLGALFGILLGIALALLRERVDRKLRDAGDVAAAFDAPILATIPRNRALARRAPFNELPPRLADAFFMLQSNLHYGRHGRAPRSMIVTSARERQGKTTVAVNLAAATSAAGFSVALVDADLRSSDLAVEHGLRSFPGLTEVLRDDLPAAEALQQLSPGVRDGLHFSEPHNVDVLVAGARPQDPGALIQSPSMTRVLDELMETHDLVIVDTPPIAQVADAIPLLRKVEGVLIVASVHSTRGAEAEQLRGQLQSLDALLLGVVANGVGGTGNYPRSSAKPAYAP